MPLPPRVETLADTITHMTIASVAIGFVISDEHWPAFAAWCEQHEPDTTWTEEDRAAIADTGIKLAAIKQRAEIELAHDDGSTFCTSIPGGCPIHGA